MNGDTLLARITPCLENGKAAFVHFLSEEEVGWGSTEYIVMKPKSFLHPFFSYVLAKNESFKEYAESCMEGSTGRQRINIEHLKDYKVTLPSKDIIEKYNETLNSFLPKLISNSNQIQTLQSLRDTLLPKLISGEIRLKGFAEKVEGLQDAS